MRIKAQPLDAETASYLFDWKAKELWQTPDRFPKLTSEEFFASTAPLEIEIGTSTGEFLCDLAHANPETNFLGIEVSQRAAGYAAGFAAKGGLKNVRILRANFKFLRPLMQAGAWTRVYLHFPDPVHKHRDEKRRIFDQAFLDQMAFVLVRGGDISVVSDKPDYLEAMLALAERDPRFERAHSERYLKFEPTAKSRFQRFWERKGINAQQFILRRV